MKIITISREFGSGGRELGRYLAEIMGFDYYDKNILTAIAQNQGLDADYVANRLEHSGFQTTPITYHRTITSTHYGNTNDISLLVEQKKVIEQIAALGKDCVIVGRNADVILKEYQPLNLFVCADTKTKITRCMERSYAEEHFTEKELLHKMKQIDKMRAKTREILSDLPWGEKHAYHLTINTGEWDLKELALAVSDFTNNWFRRTK